MPSYGPHVQRCSLTTRLRSLWAAVMPICIYEFANRAAAKENNLS
jgi:hypothetical protein